MQRLTPTQLKQIAHVLQQRSQEAAASNEKVVYRSVYALSTHMYYDTLFLNASNIQGGISRRIGFTY